MSRIVRTEPAAGTEATAAAAAIGVGDQKSEQRSNKRGQPKESLIKDDNEIRITETRSFSAYVARAGIVFNDFGKTIYHDHRHGQCFVKGSDSARGCEPIRRFAPDHDTGNDGDCGRVRTIWRKVWTRSPTSGVSPL